MFTGFASQEEMDIELDKFPDIDAYKAGLKHLVSLDKTTLTTEEIRKLWFEYAVLFPHPIGSLPPETANTLTVFRVRLNIDRNTEDLSLIRTFSYPNPCFCKANGRANLVNKSVFYCADNITTAIREAKPKAGDMAHISVWTIHCDKQQVNYAALFPASLPPANPWAKIAVTYYDKQVEYAREIGKDKAQQLILLSECVAELYIREQTPYPLTSWMANSILYESLGIDYLVYPSFTMNSDSCNFAFHPNFVDKYFTLQKVFKCRIDTIADDDFNLSIGQESNADFTSLSWQKPVADSLQKYFPGVVLA